MSQSSHLKADVLLLSVTLLAAAGWIFSKEALAGLPPLLFIGIRFFSAGLILAIVGRRALMSLSARQLRIALSTGVLFAAAMCLWISGLFYGDHVGEGAFITSLAMVLAPLVSRVIFGEKLALATWLALPVATCGLALLSLRNGLHLELGQLFFLASAVLFSLNFTLNTHMTAKVPVIALTTVQLLTVGVAASGLSLALEEWPQQVSASIWGWVAASAVIATSLRFFLQTFAQSLTPVSHAAVIMTMEPVFTTLMALVWLGETMSGMQMLGCFLIFSALLINRWRAVRVAFKGLMRENY
ncbi:Permease of the drug/metabolite transporter (DMT) superfamily [Hahella chejuensis KCTC 2396]|uniref:Permease of the drug/metabolite transporter (DMT) superfamily n=1 Tax=Hahella chejuensis (strain KCTC 2396) TaxID=349521 RepID=Q2SKE4_HAHCH|nr:DMT family transporter [Hahella chejuensis]ABC28880.1 Permease of the drug/metabolite transporter (DMT) superfamily [Hahella chejuensis KCTC 2396]